MPNESKRSYCGLLTRCSQVIGSLAGTAGARSRLSLLKLAPASRRSDDADRWRCGGTAPMSSIRKWRAAAPVSTITSIRTASPQGTARFVHQSLHASNASIGRESFNSPLRFAKDRLAIWSASGPESGHDRRQARIRRHEPTQSVRHDSLERGSRRGRGRHAPIVRSTGEAVSRLLVSVVPASNLPGRRRDGDELRRKAPGGWA